MGNPHTNFPAGRRLHVILKDGGSFVDRYKAKHSRSVEFEARGRVAIEKIRSITYQKGTTQEASDDQ